MSQGPPSHLPPLLGFESASSPSPGLEEKALIVCRKSKRQLLLFDLHVPTPSPSSVRGGDGSGAGTEVSWVLCGACKLCLSFLTGLRTKLTPYKIALKLLLIRLSYLCDRVT